MQTIGKLLFGLIRQFVSTRYNDSYDGAYTSVISYRKGALSTNLHVSLEEAFAYGVETVTVELEVGNFNLTMDISDVTDYRIEFTFRHFDPSIPF